jgi:hypothetical protein
MREQEEERGGEKDKKVQISSILADLSNLKSVPYNVQNMKNNT